MVRSNKYGLVLAAIFLLMFVIAGCGGNQQGGAVSQPTQVQETENQEARVIQHAMGTTEVKGTPKKVVTLFQGATDAALVLKIKPVGAVESWIEQPWYNYIRAQMEGATNLGSENQPDLEKIGFTST